MSEDTRKRYRCDCVCGHTFWATKSIFQTWGVDHAGHGRCTKCDVFMNLTFDAENECMIVTPWEEHIKKKQEESKDD